MQRFNTDEDFQWLEKFNGAGRIKSFLMVFNIYRKLMGVGELNLYWRSSMDKEVQCGCENWALIEFV